MSKPNDSTDDKEQLTTPITDYRALLEMTRALVIAKNTILSPQGQVDEEETMSPESEDSRRESALKTGEIIYPNPSGQKVTDDKAAASLSDSPQKDDDFNFRIYLGMS